MRIEQPSYGRILIAVSFETDKSKRDVSCSRNADRDPSPPTRSKRTTPSTRQVKARRSITRIGDYILYTDEHNWIVAKVYVSPKGKERRQLHSYFPRLDQALEKIIYAVDLLIEWSVRIILNDADWLLIFGYRILSLGPSLQDELRVSGLYTASLFAPCHEVPYLLASSVERRQVGD